MWTYIPHKLPGSSSSPGGMLKECKQKSSWYSIPPFWRMRQEHTERRIEIEMDARPPPIMGIGKAKSMPFCFIFLALLPLVFFISSRSIDVTTLLQPTISLKSTSLITLNCRNQTAPPPKNHQTPPPPPPPPPPPASPASRCPLYFRWMHEDLRPWAATGITREMLESARPFATFRLVILGGRVYVDRYRQAFQTRDLFTLWGILQLVVRYPGGVPDLDLVFNCDDTPVVNAAAFRSSPPPLFRYCKNDETLDIVFPDWSFWGWSEINIRGWERMVEELKKSNERVRWKKRKAFAYWKGNPSVSDSRRELIKCNVSEHQDWNARLFAQDWHSEIRQGFKNSNMAAQCDYRYKIYVEGRAWSVSKKYILACNSPALFVTPHFHDFFSRALMPGVHYWPLNEHRICSSIKSAVQWGNRHQEQAEATGRAGSRFVQEELKMEYVYDYMLNLLVQYAQLLRYRPSVPENSTEICSAAMACAATGLTKELFAESMEKTARVDAGPCEMPRPFTAEELRETAEKKANAARQVEEMWEQGASG